MSESICTVRLFPLFQVVSSGKGSKSRSKLWNAVCADKEWQAWAVPLEKGLLGGLVLGGVWKVEVQALSTIFARGKPYSEALLTVPKLPCCGFVDHLIVLLDFVIVVKSLRISQAVLRRLPTSHSCWLLGTLSRLTSPGRLEDLHVALQRSPRAAFA